MQDMMDEPFGAMLWRRRVDDNFPLCVMASVLGIPIHLLAEIEMGWCPAPESECMMRLVEYAYDFSPSELALLRRKAEESRLNGPCDLTEYLGITLPYGPKNEIPIYRPSIMAEKECTVQISVIQSVECIAPKASETAAEWERNSAFPKAQGGTPLTDIVASEEIFKRIYVGVVAEPLGRNNVIPREVIWQDGRHFSVDRVLSAKQSAVMLTGGVGTRYTCEIKGRRRDLCFEQRNQWFVECRVN